MPSFSFVSYISLVLFLGIASNLFSQAKTSSFRDFKGLQSAFYDDETGRRYLHVKYKEATAEKPKVGFLRFGLAFLKIHDLRIELDTRWASQGTILELFQKVASKRGVRYAVAKPIELIIRRKDGDVLYIKANKGKFTSAGSLKVWGDVVFSMGDSETRATQLSLTVEPSSNALVLSTNEGKAPILIPLNP